MSMEAKTNVMRILDAHKVSYKAYSYVGTGALNGQEVATALNQNPAQVFKTLVTVAKSGQHYVFMVPVCAELDLKRAATVVGEKSIDMLKSRDLLGLTGYVHGGCSPIGMKKQFPTYIHETCMQHPYIYISAGVRGLQLKLAPQDLIKEVRAEVCTLF